MLLQEWQENFSRTCWITFHWRGMRLQRLGDVLADFVQSPTATRTNRGCGIDDALARQMLRQRPARRLAPLEAAHFNLGRCSCHLRRRFRLSGIFFHLRERQLELLQDGAPLRRLAELVVAQLGDRIFELLDQQRPVLRLALGGTGTRFRGGGSWGPNVSAVEGGW
jgi:hypothetical protein